MTVGDYVRAIFKFLEDHNGAVTAVATVVMAVFTAFLWYSTRKLWLAGERQAARSKEEFEYTKKKLEESAEQAQKQTLLVSQQTDILAQQEEISRQQFLATHRPRLVLRDVFTISGPGERFDVIYALANIGGVSCFIVRSTLLLAHHPPGSGMYMLKNTEENMIGGVIIKPGEQYRGTYTTKAERVPMGWAVRNVGLQATDYYLHGWIAYEDEAKIQRHMGFLLCLDYIRKRFFALDRDKDLNYSD